MHRCTAKYQRANDRSRYNTCKFTATKRYRLSHNANAWIYGHVKSRIGSIPDICSRLIPDLTTVPEPGDMYSRVIERSSTVTSCKIALNVCYARETALRLRYTEYKTNDTDLWEKMLKKGISLYCYHWPLVRMLTLRRDAMPLPIGGVAMMLMSAQR